MYQWEDFITRYCDLSKKDFIEHFSLPLLLIEKLSIVSINESDDSDEKNVTPKHGRIRRTPAALPAFETGYVKNVTEEADLIAHGRKPGTKPLKNNRLFDFKEAQDRLMMVSVGRVSTNIICLNSNHISKFHAYFQNSKNKWTVTDANSFNGTMVNGEEIPGKKPHPVHDGDSICFGTAYVCTFFSSQSFYEYMTL